MTVVLMVGIAVAIGATLLLGYIRTGQVSSSSARASQGLETVSNAAIQVVKASLAVGTGDSRCAALDTAMKGFRNFWVDPYALPAPLSFTQGTCSGDTTLVDCVIPRAQACGTGRKVDDMTINILRVGKPDPVTMTSTLSVTISGTLAQNAQKENVAKSFNVNHTFRMKVSSLAQYALVVTDWNNVASNVAPTATVEVAGHMLYAPASGAQPIALESIAGPNVTNLWFDQSVDIVAAKVTTSSYLVSPAKLSNIRKIFRGGYFAAQYDSGFLPFNGNFGNPYPGAPGILPWQKTFDFHLNVDTVSWTYRGHVLTDPTPWGAPTYVSQQNSGSPLIATKLAMTNYIDPPVGLVAGSTPPTGALYVPPPVTANVYNFPLSEVSLPPNVSTYGLKRLQDSCNSTISAGSANNPPNGPFVFENKSADVVINYGVTDSKFCGFIAANSVTIQLNGTSNAAFTGIILTGSMQIKGAGKVTFTNFADASVPADLATDFSNLGAGIAGDFFLPIFKTYPANLPRGFRPSNPFMFSTVNNQAPCGCGLAPTVQKDESYQAPMAIPSIGGTSLPNVPSCNPNLPGFVCLCDNQPNLHSIPPPPDQPGAITTYYCVRQAEPQGSYPAVRGPDSSQLAPNYLDILNYTIDEIL